MDDAAPRLSPAGERRAQALAAERGLTIEQARAVMAEHGDDDEDTLSAALENVKSFLRAPS